jgi:signal transduction histidine kinase
MIFLFIAALLVGVFFFRTYQLASKASAIAAKDLQLAHLVDILDETTIEFANGLADFSQNVFSRSPDNPHPKAHREKIQSLLKEARSLIGESNVDPSIISEVETLSLEQYNLLISTKPGADNSRATSIQTFLDYMPRAKKLGSKILELRNRLLAERKTLENLREEAHETTEQMKAQTVIGLACAALFLIILAVSFLQDITKRLNLLMENAKLLPGGKSLPNTVSGSDEIAYLDQVLHLASQQLQRAAEHRKSMVQMLAHDIRGPIASSKLSLATLSRTEDPKQAVSSIKSAENDLNRAVVLLEDLLTIDRLEAGKLDLEIAPIELHTLIAQVTEALATLASAKGIEIAVASEEPIVIEGDRARLMQVLQNLIINAINHSDKSTTITISYSQQPDHTKICIKDCGKGISRENQAQIFDPFVQAEQQGKNGFGLGLAICKRLVEAHEGELGFDSKEGEGTTFWVKLPREADV